MVDINTVKVGDKLQTLNMMFFVDAFNPATGEDYETKFERHEILTVCDVSPEENIIHIDLGDGCYAILSPNDLCQLGEWR